MNYFIGIVMLSRWDGRPHHVFTFPVNTLAGPAPRKPAQTPNNANKAALSFTKVNKLSPTTISFDDLRLHLALSLCWLLIGTYYGLRFV